MRDPDCVFCKIVAGKIRARVVKQNERAMAFLDAFPLAAGHTLIVPKSHYAKIQEMDSLDVQAVFDLMHKITDAVEFASKTSASTIAIHNGREAGQEVPHVHIHIVPRRRGDGAGPIHSMFRKPRLTAEEMDAMLGMITSRLD